MRRIYLRLFLPRELRLILDDILAHCTCPEYDGGCGLCRLKRYLS